MDDQYAGEEMRGTVDENGYIWYDQDFKDNSEISKDEGYQNDKQPEGSEYYETEGYGEFDAEEFPQNEDGTYEDWYNNYEQYGYYDESGNFIYNEDYNYAYGSEEQLDTSESDANKRFSSTPLITSLVTTTKSTVTTTSASSTTTTATAAASKLLSFGNQVLPFKTPAKDQTTKAAPRKLDAGGLFNKFSAPTLPKIGLKSSTVTTTTTTTTTSQPSKLLSGLTSLPLNKPSLPTSFTKPSIFSQKTPEQIQKEKEEQIRVQEEKKRKEEQAKLEKERLEQEKQALKLENERQQQLQLQQEQMQQEQNQQITDEYMNQQYYDEYGMPYDESYYYSEEYQMYQQAQQEQMQADAMLTDPTQQLEGQRPQSELLLSEEATLQKQQEELRLQQEQELQRQQVEYQKQQEQFEKEQQALQQKQEQAKVDVPVTQATPKPAQAAPKQQQTTGGFGLFGNKSKTTKAGGGLFGGLSGFTSKMSDTLNTAVKEVSAAAAQTASAAQQASKTAAAKPGGIPGLPGQLGKTQATTAATAAPANKDAPSAAVNNSRQQLKKQESVSSEYMPPDETEKSLSTLPESRSLESGSQVSSGQSSGSASATLNPYWSFFT